MLSRLARLAAYIGHANARYLLVACGLVTGLTVALGLVFLSLTLRANTIARAESDLQNLSLVLSEETGRSIEAVELIQLGIMRDLRNRGIDTPAELEQLAGSFEEHQDLARRVGDAPHIAEMALVDRNGQRLVYSRYWQRSHVDDTDRDLVRAQLAATGPRFFISAPSQNSDSGKRSIYLSRGFTAIDGQLLGIVVASIETDYFEQLFSRISLPKGSALALYRNDGVLLARYPPVDPRFYKISADMLPRFEGLLAAKDHGAIRLISVLDGMDRLVAPHSVAGYPLVMTVSNTVDATLADWLVQERVLAGAVLLMEIIITATIVLGVRHLHSYEMLESARLGEVEARSAQTRAEAALMLAQQREDAAHMLQTQAQRFDMALNNMLHGLMMFDDGGRLLVVNRRFLQMFGMPDDGLIPGMDYAEVTNRIVTLGNISAADMANYRERRTELIRQNISGSSAWEVSDGRSYTVTHEVMAKGWLSTYEDITSRRMAEARVSHLTRHDILTDLPNRLLFHEELDAALTRARRGQTLALLCLDVDQFKAVNDTLGHAVGDSVLRQAADRLEKATRPSEIVARLGGDEFAVIQPDIERPTEATTLAGRLIELLAEPFDVAGHQIVIGASIGIAFSPQDGADVDQLLKSADLALYRAKADGRGVYRLFHTEMDAQMQSRRLLELDLRQAMANGQFELNYQPFVNLSTRTVSGMEALLRWRHPERGMIPPSLFVPLAEEIGLIGPIGEWVLHQACADMAAWPNGLRVAINLSALQFKSPTLIAAVERAMRDANLSPSRVELEITETAMLQDTEANLAILHQLRGLGVNIAMDDFGTGYSSLGYLLRFPFDRIKIDQSFVRDICSRLDGCVIVRAVAGLGNDLGMATTAEGVETQEQLDAVTLAGCTEVQGYLFSKPVAANAVAALLDRLAVRLRPASTAEFVEPIA